jgi:signal transduction histidine kinase
VSANGKWLAGDNGWGRINREGFSSVVEKLPLKDLNEEERQMGSEAGTRMVALHKATLTLFSDLSLDGVLRRIIQAAQDLSGARYAALGIPDGRGGLETFLTLGMTEKEIRQIPHEPVGNGLIGEMMRTGKGIRVPEIAEHPRSVGFPDGHPEMHSFLGVPITAYGRPLGQIYLTDKQDADKFSSEDQRLIEMLAAHAAAAIENARLYRQVLNSEAELTQRNLELELVNSLATAASSSTELTTLLEVILERIMTLFGSGVGEFYIRDEAEGIYIKAIHRGESIGELWDIDQFRPGQGMVGNVAKLGRPRWTQDLKSEPHLRSQVAMDAGFGMVVGVPLTAPGKVVGVMVLAFLGDRQLNDREIGLLEAVGAGVGIAVENTRLYRHARRLAILEERERIGMDLHDGIIQSIYAVGLVLDYVRILVEEDPQQAGDRIEQAIDGLNSVIGDIRSYILDLQPSRIQIEDLGKALELLAREFKTNTLVEVELIAESAALQTLDGESATEIFHIAQEALANTAKHAFATRVWLNLRQVEDEISLQVIDNGRGFHVDRETDILGHGLSNMTERARQLGGHLEIESNPGDGTTLTVRIPMDHKEQIT